MVTATTTASHELLTKDLTPFLSSDSRLDNIFANSMANMEWRQRVKLSLPYFLASGFFLPAQLLSILTPHFLLASAAPSHRRAAWPRRFAGGKQIRGKTNKGTRTFFTFAYLLTP